MDDENKFFDNNVENNNSSNPNARRTSDDEETIACPKCGKPMKKTLRCCMHCGELNYLNDKNDSVKSYFIKGKKAKKRDKDEIDPRLLVKDKKGRTVLERRHTFFKRLGTFFCLLILVFAGINYKFVVNKFEDFRKWSYVRQARKIIHQFDAKYNNSECVISESGEQIYVFLESDDDFKTFVSLYTLGYFKGYIKVVNTPDGIRYYMTLTDGKYGFEDLLTATLSEDKVEKYSGPETIPNATMYCK